MYLDHYNLTLKPFEISPDPKFLWLGEKHNEALAAMIYGILDNKGFISLTGDVGSGKTTLVNALTHRLDDNIILAKFFDPPLEKLDFFNSAADAFGMNKKFSTKGDFLNHLRSFLNKAYDHNQEVVLVIEEAQRFNQEQLEEIRLISNIERPDKKLINIVFVGQNEFDILLKKNKPLRQRVAIAHKIGSLQENETKQYVIHRLKTAGSENEIFSPGAFREIYSFSEGNPRLINIICDLALLTGYAENKRIIEQQIIRECALNRLLPTQQKEAAIGQLKASSEPILETEIGLQPAVLADSHQKTAKKVPPKPTGFKFAYVTSMSVVFLLSIFGYLYLFGENHAPYRNFKTFLGQAFDRYTASKLETSSQKPDEITTQQSTIAGTPIQTLDLIAQKASFESQIGQLKSRNEALSADLAELKGVKEKITELEGTAAKRKQTLSQVKQKISELTNALDQEKKGQDLLRAELSTNADQVSEIQEKLQTSQSNAKQFQKEIEEYKIEIKALKGQLLELQTQKTSADTQLGQLKSRNAALAVELAELRGAKERIAELEEAENRHEQSLSQAEQKVTELNNALDREKASKETLNSEISIKTDLIAELQEELVTALSGRAELEKNVETSKKEIEALEKQLLDISAQKTPTENQLEHKTPSYEELTADLQELKGVKEHVATLEDDLATIDQALSRSEQQISYLEKELDQEKKRKEMLNSELSLKADLVAELQEKLEATLSSRAELEDDIKKSKIENMELQSQLKELKAQQAPTESSPPIVDAKKESPSTSEAFSEQGEAPSPIDIIDWVFKKKAK